ncbi:MAG: hypothetical protein NTU49_01665 [Gammaproteobacteria bacterium]|nr:hypothetical protein [Gammaproteobacteria bacterium]
MKHIKLIQAVVATSLVCAGMTASAHSVYLQQTAHISTNFTVNSATVPVDTWGTATTMGSLSVALPSGFNPSNPVISLPAPTTVAGGHTLYAVYFDRKCSSGAKDAVSAVFAIASAFYTKDIINSTSITCAASPIATGTKNIFVTVGSVNLIPK